MSERFGEDLASALNVTPAAEFLGFRRKKGLHLCRSRFQVKLQRGHPIACLKCLVPASLAGTDIQSAGWQRKRVPVPMERCQFLWKFRKQIARTFSAADNVESYRKPADFNLGVLKYLAAEGVGNELCAETNTEHPFFRCQRRSDHCFLVNQPRMASMLINVHWPAQNHQPVEVIERWRGIS